MSTSGPTAAIVFPGQGSQRPGMGRDFHTEFAVSREAFSEASDALGLDVAALCFSEDPRLNETEFTQPCILTVEIAMVRALERELGLTASYFGGHSLGEYSALCAAGVMSLGDAARLTRRRGWLMQRAVPKGEGAMLAIIADGIGARDLALELAPFAVDVANRNSPDQVVLSGRAEAVARAKAHLAQALAGVEHRLVELNVSAPFHSRWMRDIEREFGEELARAAATWRPERAACCTSNAAGGFHGKTAAAVVAALTRQVSSPVDWIANMNTLGDVAAQIYEVGPGKPLTAFFRSVGRAVTPLLSLKAARRALGVEPAGANTPGAGESSTG